MRNQLFIIIIPVILSLQYSVFCSAGKAFKWVDEQGNVHFSDKPPEEAKISNEYDVVSSPIKRMTKQEELDARKKKLDLLLIKQAAEDRARSKQLRKRKRSSTVTIRQPGSTTTQDESSRRQAVVDKCRRNHGINCRNYEEAAAEQKENERKSELRREINEREARRKTLNGGR